VDKRALFHEPADAQPLPGARRFLRKLARSIEKDNIVTQCDEHEPHGEAEHGERGGNQNETAFSARHD
jgi:hypothetical protein